MNTYVQANTNGRLHDAREPSISPLDRSFLYGDSVYEVVRTYQGTIFTFAEHWQRLQQSAQAISLPLSIESSVMLTEIRRTVSAYFEHTAMENRPDLYIRWQISRGGGEIGLDPQCAEDSFYVILVKALPEEDGGKKNCDLTLGKSIRRNSKHALNPAWKTGNYLNNVLGLREARQRKKADILLLNNEGFLTEASTSNLFLVRDQKLFTPPLEDGLLGGITRRLIIDQARSAWDIDVLEQSIAPDELGLFEECFLTSTTRGIRPVHSIDKHTYKVHSRTLTARLVKTFARYVEQYNQKNAKHALF